MEQAIVKLSQAPMPKPDVLVEAAGILYSAGRSYPFAAELLHRYLNAGRWRQLPHSKPTICWASCWKNKGTRQAQRREYRASLALARNFGTAQQALTEVAH